MLKKIISHTAIYGLAPQISKVANFFILPIITKDLTEIDYGIAGLMDAYIGAISVFSVLGLRLILINSFYKSPGQYKWLWRQIYGFLTLWNFIYAVILSILIYLAVPDAAIENRSLIVILNVGPIIFFGQTSTIARTFYQVKQQPLQIGIRAAIFGIINTILNLYFISYLKMGYMGWFISAFIIGMISNLSYWYPLNYKINIKPIFNFKWRLIKDSLKVSFPTIPHYYSGYLLDSSDKMVMDLTKIGTGDIGKYNIAYTVANFMKLIGNSGGVAMGPILNERYKNKDDAGARNIIFLLQTMYFILTFSICIWLKEIFHFMIRIDTLGQMYYLGVILVMSYNYRPMYLGAISKLMYEEKTNILWKISFTAGIINVGLNLILIPIFGFEAAAYTTFIAFIFMGYAGYYLGAYKNINHLNYFPNWWICGSVMLTILAYFTVELAITYKIIITLITAVTGTYILIKLQNKIRP